MSHQSSRDLGEVPGGPLSGRSPDGRPSLARAGVPKGRPRGYTGVAPRRGPGRGSPIGVRMRCRGATPLFDRLWLALRAFWRTSTDPAFASRVEPLFAPATAGHDL